MATKIYLRRGTRTEVLGIVPEEGEPVWAKDTKALYVGDDTTSGGIFVGGLGVGVDALNALIGAITLSGGTGIVVTVSGQYIIIEEEAGGLDVDSLNALTGVVTISGVGVVSVSEDGQKIVVSGEDVIDVDSLNGLTGVVTISGAGITEVTEDGQKIVITSTETNDVDSLNSLIGVVTISGKAGVTVTEEGQVIVVSGNLGQIENFLMNDFEYPAPGSDWTPTLEGAYLSASGTSKKCWIPIDSLKEGDEILSYRLIGDVVEVTAVTLDCKLVRVNKADPITTTDVLGGAITQIDADGNFDSLATLSGAEVIATDKQYVLEILGTTDASDAIIVMGAEVQARIN